MIEVDDVTDGVEQREKEGSESTDFMKLNVSIKRNVLLDGKLFELGEEVSRHGQQQEAVAERERRGGTTGDGDTDAHDVTQICVFGHE